MHLIEVSEQIEMVNQEVQACLRRRHMLKNVVAIVAFGSMTRGEELLIEHNNNVRILSDLDLAIIANDKGLSAYLIGRQIPRILEVVKCPFKVSLSVAKPRDLTSTRTLLLFDMKFFGKVLFGDKEILDRICLTSARDIPSWEGIRLLLNNGVMELLRVFDPNDGKNFKTNSDRALEFVEACGKVYLACYDSLLVRDGSYSPSVREKGFSTEIFQTRSSTLYNRIPNLLDKARHHMELRTRRKKLRIPNYNFNKLFEMWLDARKCCLETVRYYLTSYLDRRMECSTALENLRFLSSKRQMSIMFRLLQMKMPRLAVRVLLKSRPPMLMVHQVAMLLLKSVNSDNTINRDVLKKALNSPLKVHMNEGAQNPERDWRMMKDTCMRYWGCLPDTLVFSDNELGFGL